VNVTNEVFMAVNIHRYTLPASDGGMSKANLMFI